MSKKEKATNPESTATETVDTVTLTSKDKVFQYTVKREFLSVCPDPENYDFLDLLNNFQFIKYLHNPNGPALVTPEIDACEYWLNGIPLSEEEEKKIKNKLAVKTDIQQLVNE